MDLFINMNSIYDIMHKNIQDNYIILDDDNIKNYKENKIIIFKTNKYLCEIFESYKYNKKKIWKQFIIDCNRHDIIVNNEHVMSTYRLKKILREHKLKYTMINILDKNVKLIDVLGMLCTQASFALPFIILNKLYTKTKEYIYVTNSSIRKQIDIKIKDNIIYINMQSVYKLINITKNKNIIFIDTMLSLEFNLKKKNVICKHGIYSWKLS